MSKRGVLAGFVVGAAHKKRKRLSGESTASVIDNGEAAEGGDNMGVDADGGTRAAAETASAEVKGIIPVAIPLVGSTPRSHPLITPTRLEEGWRPGVLSFEDEILSRQIKSMSRAAASDHIKATNELVSRSVSRAVAESKKEIANLHRLLASSGIPMPIASGAPATESSRSHLAMSLAEVRCCCKLFAC
jgi:hypothetical protein